MSVTPQLAISYLNTLVMKALQSGAAPAYYPLFNSKNVTALGVSGDSVHAYQGPQGDPIHAAMSVLDLALQGMPRTVEVFRKRYADWEGPGKPPAWLEPVVAALTAMGAFAGQGVPPVVPPVVTPPVTPPPTPEPPTLATLHVRLLAVEARLHAIDGK